MVNMTKYLLRIIIACSTADRACFNIAKYILPYLLYLCHLIQKQLREKHFKMLVKKGILLLIFLLCLDVCVSTSDAEGIEYIKYSVCGKLPLHTVSDKFISISIDPLTLLDGINIT